MNHRPHSHRDSTIISNLNSLASEPFLRSTLQPYPLLLHHKHEIPIRDAKSEASYKVFARIRP